MTAPPALFALAVQHLQAGNLEQAQAACRRILDHEPAHAGALNILGMLAHQAGDNERAIYYLRCAIAASPHDGMLHYNLGVAYQTLGRTAEAIASYHESLRLQPNHADSHYNLGRALSNQGNADGACTCFQQALRLQPDHANAHHALGLVYADRGDFAEAAKSFEQALTLCPGFELARKNLVVAHCKLEASYRERGDLEAVQRQLEQAMRVEPRPGFRFAAATLLPAIYQSVADIEQRRQRLTTNIQRLHEEGFRADLSREVPTLFYLTYQGLNDRDIQRAVAGLFEPPVLPPRPRRPDAARPIKIGFVSRFFRKHTIAELFGGLITELDRRRFMVTLISIGRHDDTMAQRLQQAADRFVALSDTDLSAARNRLAEENLDVLFFTDIGMEPISYVLAFSRFAPVQCATWGHPVTTGISTIDYFISSDLLETTEADEHYSETLVRLPGLPVCYRRPELPHPARGRAHFQLPEDAHLYGCPQSLFKFHPEFDVILGEILRRDPRGFLVLIHGQHRHWDELLLKRFSATIPAVLQQIRFLDSLPQADFLALLACCDVLLDPLHFGGGNTSYQALAFGTPIVTLPSRFLRGRITQALYRQMNVLDCVTATPQEYIDLAVRLGCDADYRESVRARILAANSVLYENRSGIIALENFLEQAVRTRLRGRCFP